MAARTIVLLAVLGAAVVARGEMVEAQACAVADPIGPRSAQMNCNAPRGEVYCDAQQKCVLPDAERNFCLPATADFFRTGDFLWGASSSAYQIEGAAAEGGRGPSNWDVFSHLQGKTHNGDTGDVAADSYHKYAQDIALLRDLGVKYYRFSISWSRLLPAGTGAINEEGLAYYNTLIDGLLSSGIVPVVCLFHWDLPQSLEEQGGWLNRDLMLRSFGAYADTAFGAFGDRVKMWVTMNEPGTVVYMGYNAGLMAPGRCSDRSRCPEGDSDREPLIAGHNMLLAHAEAVSIFRGKHGALDGKGKIGMVNCVKWAEPQDRSQQSQWQLAQFLMEAEIGFFTDPLYFGDYPPSIRATADVLPAFTAEERLKLAGSQDFFGLNFYTSHYVWDPQNGGGIGPQGGSSWLFVTPGGLRNQLHWITQRYGAPPIIITESGCDLPEAQSDDPRVPDTFRIAYYHEYLEQAALAALEGVNLQGFFIWSLLDNFEWADGYAKRFGIVHVDFQNAQKRTPKESFRWFRRLLRQVAPPRKQGATAAAPAPPPVIPQPARARPSAVRRSWQASTALCAALVGVALATATFIGVRKRRSQYIPLV